MLSSPRCQERTPTQAVSRRPWMAPGGRDRPGGADETHGRGRSARPVCPQAGWRSGGGEGRRERSRWWDLVPVGWTDTRPLRLLREGGWWGAGRTVSARPRRLLSGSCCPSVLPLPLSFWVIRESSLIGASQAHAPQQARHSKRPPRSREVFSAQKPWPTRPAARRPCQPPLPQDRSPAPRTASRPRPGSHAARPLARRTHVPGARSAAATAGPVLPRDLGAGRVLCLRWAQTGASLGTRDGGAWARCSRLLGLHHSSFGHRPSAAVDSRPPRPPGNVTGTERRGRDAQSSEGAELRGRQKVVCGRREPAEEAPLQSLRDLKAGRGALALRALTVCLGTCARVPINVA